MKMKKVFVLTAIFITLSTATSYGATVEYRRGTSDVYVSGSVDRLSHIEVKATSPDNNVYYSNYVKDEEDDYDFTIPVFRDDVQGVYSFRISTTNSAGATSQVTFLSIPGMDGSDYTLECFNVSGTLGDEDFEAECTFSKIDPDHKPMLIVAAYRTVTSIKDGSEKEHELVAVSQVDVNATETKYVANLPEFEKETSTGNIDDQVVYTAKAFLWTKVDSLKPLAYSYEINE